MDEVLLLKKIKDGDIAAFREIVDQYKNQVINTCYRFLLNKEDAEDISQEVFIEIFQSIKSFRQDSKFSTWIYRITITKCLDEIKKRNRKKRISSAGRILKLDEVVFWLTGGKKADSIVTEKENRQMIMNALNQLPDNQRVAFVLSKMDGYTNNEIADILQTSIMSVESLIYRAKRKMNEQLSALIKKND